MRSFLRVASVAFLLCLPTLATADPFTILPNGDLQFNVALKTTGIFTCTGGVPCSGSGTNAIQIGSGENVASIAFVGVDTTAAVVGLVPITLGEIEASASEAFVFPESIHPAVAVVRFTLSIQHSSPIEDASSLTFELGPGGGTFLPLLRAPRDYIRLDSGPNPPGYAYTGLIYTLGVGGIPRTGTFAVAANVGAVPEPATFALVTAGLAVASLRRRRASGRARLW